MTNPPSTINLNGECVTLEQLAEAWKFYKKFDEASSEHFKRLFEQCVNRVYYEPTFDSGSVPSPLTEPDPQG